MDMARGQSPLPGRWIRPASFSLVFVLFLVTLSQASPSAAAAGPSLVITSPSDNAVIGNGTPVLVTFAVANFTLVQPGRVGQIPSPTEGYLNVYVDDAYARLVTQVQPISLPLPSGPHTIRLQLVQTNGTPLNPDVSASVHVVATQGPVGGKPTIRIVAPNPGESTGHDIYVFVQVTNFTIVSAHGQPNAPNEGHVQLVRGAYVQDLGPSNFGFLVDQPDGNNTLVARLVNNDGTPLSPAVSANVTFVVRIAASPQAAEEFTGAVGLLLAGILVILVYRRRKAAARFRRDPAPKP